MTPLLLLIIGMVIVLGGILVLRMHPVLALLAGAIVVGGLTPDLFLETYALDKGLSDTQIQALLNQSLGSRIGMAFGNTCAKIGLLIALASIIGKGIMDSGGAERIVRAALHITGEKRAPIAFMGTSFVLAAPVYFDTVFYLMIPLARTMGVRVKKNYPLFIMAICAGGVMAHSLVPPTPGPLFVAGELNVSIGLMIMMGFIVGLICATAGLIYAYWLNRRLDIPIRDTPDVSMEELKKISQQESYQIPSLGLSILPIVLPLILIAGDTILSISQPDLPTVVFRFFETFGDPIIALAIGAIPALYLLSKKLGHRFADMEKPVQNALYSAGVIVLITASGGAFGAMLQQSSIGSWLASFSSEYHIAALPLAFIVSAVIRSAQGSATVAMITAVGILAAFSNASQIAFHPVYLAIVIGCGSKIFPWMNDSGFWIVCRMSGFTEKETIRTFSLLLCVMGVVGLFATMLLAKLFPLI